MPRNIARPGLAIAVVLVAALSGCGGGDGSQAAVGSFTPQQVVQPTPAPSTPTPRASAKPRPTPAPSPTKAPAKAVADPVMLTIKNFTYGPMALTIKLGQSVVVVNLDTAIHTVTSDDGSIDSGDLAQGQRYTFTPKARGTYSYICDIHQYMTGTITVT